MTEAQLCWRVLKNPCMLQDVLFRCAAGSPEADQAQALLQGASMSLLLGKLCRCLEDSARAAPPSGVKRAFSATYHTHQEGQGDAGSLPVWEFQFGSPVKCPP